MSGQLDINGVEQPVTWDGEPLFSPETVAEGLFDGGALEQMKGQMAMGARPEYSVGMRVFVRDRYFDQWQETEIRAVHNDGKLLEVRNPYASSSDPGATVRVQPGEVRKP